jgi:excisionase family DNA binding protein
MSTRQSPGLAPLDPLQRYNVDEACAYLRVSRGTLYNDINAGLIATIKDRSRRFVPGAEIQRRSAAHAA